MPQYQVIKYNFPSSHGEDLNSLLDYLVPQSFQAFQILERKSQVCCTSQLSTDYFTVLFVPMQPDLCLPAEFSYLNSPLLKWLLSIRPCSLSVSWPLPHPLVMCRFRSSPRGRHPRASSWPFCTWLWQHHLHVCSPIPDSSLPWSTRLLHSVERVASLSYSRNEACSP